MNTKHHPWSWLIALVAAIGLISGVSACDSGTGNDFDDAAAQTCVATLTPQQIQQASANLPQGQPTAVDTVCTYDPNTGNVHYYQQRDGLQNWAIYAAMTGRMSSLGSMYMLSGGDPFDAILMDSMIGINRGGTPFHPYSQIDGGYNRTPQVINNKTVTNVYYGSGAGTRESFSDSLTKAPVGYKTVTIPKSSTVTGAADLGNGKTPASKVTAKPGVNGQSISANAPVKRVAPGASVPNLAKPGGSGGGGGSGASAPKPGGSAPKAPSAPAPRISSGGGGKR